MNQPASSARTPSTNRTGFTLIELLVSATLLVTVISVAGQLTVQAGRLRQDAQRHQLALQELSNQLDRLTMLDEAELAQALSELAPSKRARQSLPSPQLSAERVDDANGRRLTLRLNWNRPGRSSPLTLTAWLASSPPDDPPSEQEQPQP